MKRVLCFVLAMALMITVFAGCGSSTKEPAKTEPKESEQKTAETKKWSGTLKVQMIGDFKMESATDPISGESKKGVELLKKEFEKLYPGVTLEYILMGWDGYTQKTQAMLMSGEADVYQVPGIASFAAQGLLEPLASYIEKDKYDLGQYIDGQMDGWKAMGPEDKDLQIYGLPFIGDARYIVYDKEIFDEWKVEYLSERPTMDEIMEKAKKMTGKNPVTGEQNYGLFWAGKDSADTVVNLAEGLGGSWGSGFLWKDMKVAFNSPEMVKAATWLKDAMQYAPQGVVTNQGGELFGKKENNIAMNIRVAPGTMENIRAAKLTDRYQPVYLFVSPKDEKGGLFAGSPYSIGKGSKNKELAWEYLKFTSGEFCQRYMMEQQKQLPVVKSSLQWDTVKNTPHKEFEIKSMGDLATPRYPYRSGQPRTILTKSVESVLLGKTAPVDAMNAAQKETEDWLKQQVK